MTDEQTLEALNRLSTTPKRLGEAPMFASTAYALQARGFAVVSESRGRNRARRRTLVSLTEEGARVRDHLRSQLPTKGGHG